MISRFTLSGSGMTHRAPHRQVRPTPLPWRLVAAVLCGLFALAGLLSPPVAGAALHAVDDPCLSMPAPDMPDVPADGELQAKQPRRTALPAAQRTEKRAAPATVVAMSPAPLAAPMRTAVGTFVPDTAQPPHVHPPLRDSRGRGPPAAA